MANNIDDKTMYVGLHKTTATELQVDFHSTTKNTFMFVSTKALKDSRTPRPVIKLTPKLRAELIETLLEHHEWEGSGEDGG